MTTFLDFNGKLLSIGDSVVFCASGQRGGFRRARIVGIELRRFHRWSGVGDGEEQVMRIQYQHQGYGSYKTTVGVKLNVDGCVKNLIKVESNE